MNKAASLFDDHAAQLKIRELQGQQGNRPASFFFLEDFIVTRQMDGSWWGCLDVLTKLYFSGRPLGASRVAPT